MATIRASNCDSIIQINDSDLKYVLNYRWNAYKAARGRITYAQAFIPGFGAVLLHRWLSGLQKGDKRSVVHTNGNGLDCRRSNMVIGRIIRDKNKGTKYKGISWHKGNKKWRVRIQGKDLGYYDNIGEASEFYNKKAKEIFGGFGYKIRCRPMS